MRADDPTPQAQSLGQRFIDWLRRLFAALFLPERSATSVGTAYLYGDPDDPIPAWAMLGEYDNGSAQGKGASEYLWPPTDDGGEEPGDCCPRLRKGGSWSWAFSVSLAPCAFRT